LNISIACVNKDVAASYKLCKHTYIPNCLSLERNVDRPKTREECRAALNIAPTQRVCLLLGWDLHRKGVDIALRAIERCRQSDPNILLCIVGFGISPTQKAIEYICTHTNINPHSPWIRYWPDTEDIFSYHKSADVFLSASRSEGFPYAVLEALSTNTPVCFSDIPETKWACSYENVHVYPTEDAVACAEAIRKALSTERSTSNAKKLMSDYNITKWCEQLIALYEN